MKKSISLFLAVILAAGCLYACGTGGSKPAADNGKLNIVTTIFPVYDWIMNIVGSGSADAEVTMLLDTGVDLHSFQPTAADILRISTCDLFVYVGGESDEWVENALKEAANKNMVVIDLLDALGDAAKQEEIIEGMQHEHEDEHEDEHDDGGGHDHEEAEEEYDEHIWLSLKNAAMLVNSISEAVQRVDPDNAELYKTNAAAYIGKLKALDAEYAAAVAAAAFDTLLFADRFPFRYLTDDYGLDYFAAFAGCSAETEASFETVAFLSAKVDELSLTAVLTIEGSDGRIAETIVRNTRTKDQRILTLDSMQSTTARDAANGAAYLSVMEKNLSVLKDALN